MEMHGDHSMGLLIRDHFETNFLSRTKEDENESSDNINYYYFEGASGDDDLNALGVDQDQRTQKKFHRHTPQQIQELESFFMECPHPDEYQRVELGRKLGLENKQIKFWFQNRRTQMKTQVGRQENLMLKEKNKKLRGQNELLKQNMMDAMCRHCGGPAVPGPFSIDPHQLRLENTRLKDELNHVRALMSKFLGWPVHDMDKPIPRYPSPPLSMGLDHNDGIGLPSLGQMTSPVRIGVPRYDKSMLIELALAAMDEFIRKAQCNDPLWIKSSNQRKEILNYEEYISTFPPFFGTKPSSFVSDATREFGTVISSSSVLVKALMDVNRWIEMFPSLIARASVTDVVSTGFNGTENGSMMLMQAEFQVVSPFIPLRQVKFLRFCKQHAMGIWVVVDVSVDANQESSNPCSPPACRRLPSGCIIQDMPNGCCKVTWMEHWEYNEGVVHQLYRPVLSSGRGFGAQRWLAALQRHFECLAILLNPSGGDHNAMNHRVQRSILTLSHRMVKNFCLGICGSSLCKWKKVQIENVREDTSFFVKENVNDLGEPDGVVLSASTSVWLPIMQPKLFEFLRDVRYRRVWDILSYDGSMQEVVHVDKGRERGNCVSLLHSSGMNFDNTGKSMLILQETWHDASCSLLAFAPIDQPLMNEVMNGSDSTNVRLLPSGFMIIPNDCDTNGGESLLTIGFQIFVSNMPTARLMSESIETVQKLISSTLQRIKEPLSGTNM